MNVLMGVGDGPKFYPNGTDKWPIDPVTGEKLSVSPTSRCI